VEKLLDKIGIEYDPVDKYRAADGSILPSPEKPHNLKV